MKIVQLNWNVDSISKEYRRHEINLRPPYQRKHEGVWNIRKKQLLIDSLLRDYDIPKIYLREVEADSLFKYEVVDGQQRIRAIWEFIDGKYELGEPSNDLPPPLGDLSGKYYSDLDSETKDRIGAFGLSVFEIQRADEEEIRELFQRLQEGTSLNPAEKRNAMMGDMRDFVARVAGSDAQSEPHSVLPLTNISSSRLQWDDLIALVTCVEIAGGPTDVKAVDLRRMYRDNQDFDEGRGPASRVLRHLNYMTRVLKEQPPEMDIKWGFLDLYLLISKLSGEYDIRDRASDVADFFVAFEEERRSVQDESTLAASTDPWDKDLFDYIQNFKIGGGKRDAVEERHGVYVRRFLFMVDDLVPKDPKRAYSSGERIVIWRRCHGKCESCNSPISLEEMQADHRVPHAGGGQTTIANGQGLCRQCNLAKGAT